MKRQLSQTALCPAVRLKSDLFYNLLLTRRRTIYCIRPRSPQCKAGASLTSFHHRGELNRVNDFPRQVFRAEFFSLKNWHAQLLSEGPRRVFHAEDRVHGMPRIM